ncbi:hypothetical protein Q0590_17390 [Rhodocytophaga aerolata]|uniref:Uncharacterized protein n=1 Tax=Rhodocytophaga aerolata TaxID=455078 RepID=A0ABT8R7H1_9BACT|nr:hypothetical protein [Rhodocytophaga aerolata]MDO1448051.1 hypothetical protein [Rhodocytophaga aerolata]
MIKTFTPNDVIRYVYKETSAEENKLIAYTLLTDTDLRTFYEEILGIKQEISKIMREPSDKVLGQILTYSREFQTNRP